MKNNRNNDKALAAYMNEIAQATKTLETLLEHAHNHFETAPENINWGHAGSAEHVNQKLKEITDFLGLTSED